VSSLDDDRARLDRACSRAVENLSGQRGAALSAQLGSDAEVLRRGELAGGRRAFAERFVALDEDQLETCARTHGLYCHLMNVAEERERLRVLGRREHPPDGLVATIDALALAAFASASCVRCSSAPS
jgi:hypothetical protein